MLVLALFAMYFIYNQEQFDRIAGLSFWEIFLIIIGQSLVIISNIFILLLFVQFAKKRMDFLTASRVTAYSSLVNFFGFLQGGVGLRGIYLKRYFNIGYRRYFILTLIQYAFIFGVAGLFILIGVALSTGLRQSVILLFLGAVVVVIGLIILKGLKTKAYYSLVTQYKKLDFILQTKPLVFLLLAILLQFSGSILAAAIELYAIGATLSLGGLLIYASVSQFSIIVALTPGAIGIREALLLLVQGQMQLTTSDIVVAATIDRLLYFITLALFTPLALGFKKEKSSS